LSSGSVKIATEDFDSALLMTGREIAEAATAAVAVVLRNSRRD
jgi:hypothetical protein